MMKQIYQCLRPECGKEIVSKNGREQKFCAECYKIMRKQHGTRYCANLKPVFLKYAEPKVRASKKSAKEPSLTAQVFDDHHTQLTTPDKNINGEQNESMNVLEWDTLSTNDIKYLFVELSEKNSALKLELAKYQELVNSFLCQLMDLQYPRVEVPVEPDVVLEGEMLPDKPEYDFKRICSALDCKNPVERNKAFCSKECALSMLTNKNSRMWFEGKLLEGGRNG